MLKTKFGYFNFDDPTLNGLRWGNWGSRPYEYAWCSTVESCKGESVLDIGTGLPSEHNWHRYVQAQLEPSYYLGFDLDSRIQNEEIDEPNHKMKFLNAKNLPYPDEFFTFCYSISTFEHIESSKDFFDVIKEIHRVMKPKAKMVVTLDEIWDMYNPEQQWNELERAFIREGLFVPNGEVSFSMKDFADYIKEWFKPVDDFNIPMKTNADSNLLHHPYWNSTVSYGVYERI